ncbi:MAG TPA: hypothetical protein PKW66_18145 [Polyangiaceae bacterium]|nr:hypothetical protein [Polyangiaceae bacterium]
MLNFSKRLPHLLPGIFLLFAGVHCSSEGPTEITYDPGKDPVIVPSGGSGGEGVETGGSGGNATGGAGGSSAGAAGSAAQAGGGGDSGSGGSEPPDAAPPDANFQYDAPVTDTSLNQDTACAASRVEVTLTPLDMYIMLDRSGSMVEPGYSWSPKPTGGITITGGDCNYDPAVPPLNSRWCYSVYALSGYFKSAEASGNRAALQVFPVGTMNTCPPPDFLATPLVGYQTLTGGAQTLINALNNADPLGSITPTKAALHGIAGFTSANKTSGRITIGILITDGIPNSCAPDDGATLGSIVDAHLKATGIRTYVISMTGVSPAGYQVLEAIASKGGAPSHTQYCSGSISPCHFYDVGNGDSAVFKEVLKKIQQNAIGCSYSLPTTDAGVVDLDQIAVQYTPGGTGTPIDLERVNAVGACKNNAWYYDNASPPNIVLCPSTCAVVEKDDNPRVDILVGCEQS